MSQAVVHSDFDNEAPWYWRPVNLFDGTPSETRREFFNCAKMRGFARGEHVCLADELADHLYYVVAGLVKVEHITATGNVTIFWFCVPGDLFGAGGISGSLRQGVYSRAVEDSQIALLRRTQFEELVGNHPRLALNVIKLMGGRLRLACDAMAEVTQRANLRVGRLLLRLAESCGQWTNKNEVAIRARISQQEMADMVGCTRQTVTEVLQSLSRSGIIRIEKRTIHIPSVERLRTCVEDAEMTDGGSIL
ncbi:Crp/Fnr family transcriptional regulator [Aminobacter sp. P9b]|uniref:CRP-like cAMP-binding protein n=1 Tax=Aminobacter ciceronei TaxID=150723 RepID=A0ABR6CBD2_9HYPH|nr:MULTISPECIES: Crp/Fnr family transcriptional regulator [Aminobacter]MBA8908269.1 CRP-like cAMP-binding protein [Aminobacter ciceronei]MBA9022041.1 CRP-like cAMP-binding protein [Aminobacter ciceronei]QNH34814.1 Crp/Fnr family transcriptional regulator [Aminobacter sp. MDW-2]WMC97368.1 Crp/Fnr family transcriptional regulator [Aminobacter aminovorans]